MSRCRWYEAALSTCLLALGTWCHLGPAAADEGAAPRGADAAPTTRAESTLKALELALRTNTDYCRQWLSDGDFKSLQQTATGVRLLVQVVRCQSDDAAWQHVASAVHEAAQRLEAAAGRGDAADAQAALELLRRATARLAEARPSGKPQPAAAPEAGLRPMMALLEGTYADAKAALSFGEPQATKMHARVLAELGAVLFNYRQADARWGALADEFAAACRAVAEAETDDPGALRAALRTVYQRCEACHNRP
jgi:hypothetical protein